MASQPALVHQSPNPLVSVPYSIYTGRGEGSAGMDAAMGYGPSGNQATLIIQAKPSDVVQAAVDLLGFQTISTDGERFERTLPAAHPFYPGLRCSRITSIKPMKLTGKDSSLGSPFPTYDHVLMSCLFTQPHWPIYSDSDLDHLWPPVTASDTNVYRQEWRRNTQWTPVASVEALSREAGSLIWAEGGGSGPNINPPNNTFNSPWPRFLQKQDITCRWYNVPSFDGVLSNSSATRERAVNLEKALYTVNDNPFRTYEAGTLLFRGWQFAGWNEVPLGTAPIGENTPALHLPALTVDIDLFFTWFDPPHGGATRGHNLAPFAPNTGGDGKWYKVTEATGGATLFPTSPFERIFAPSP